MEDETRLDKTLLIANRPLAVWESSEVLTTSCVHQRLFAHCSASRQGSKMWDQNLSRFPLDLPLNQALEEVKAVRVALQLPPPPSRSILKSQLFSNQ